MHNKPHKSLKHSNLYRKRAKLFRYFLGLKSQKKTVIRSKKSKNNRQGESLLDIWEKMRIKKKVDKKFGRNEVKYCGFRNFLQKYRLKQ